MTITSLIGCIAVVLGLIPATAAATDRPPAPVAKPAPTAQAIRSRLVVLERQADDAGLAAQIADEALDHRSTPATRAAADRAEAALQALAARQTPELTRLLGRLQSLGVRPGAATAAVTTAALVGRTKALRAVSYARKHIGDPYRFARSGPHAFDCSGLTMRAYKAVHVGIGGHSATAQWRKAKRQHRLVAWKHRHRGDLIFYGRPGAVYHVAIYVGRNRMIEAPYPGKRVREVKVRSWGRLSQVARPTGSRA